MVLFLLISLQIYSNFIYKILSINLTNYYLLLLLTNKLVNKLSHLLINLLILVIK